MALYSLVDKPKWLTSTQKAATAATPRGWVYTRPDGTAETLVAINRMTTKMIPAVTRVVTESASYEIGTAVTIVFTVSFNRNIRSDDITSRSVLNFLIDEGEYEAAYVSKTANSVTFRYTIPSNGDEYAIIESAEIGITDITLHTGEHIYLDFDDSDISADLTFPEATVATAVTQKVPVISGVTTDKASYTIGTDTEVIFTVDFDRNVKSSGLTAATTLDFTINATQFSADYTSTSGDDVVFTWTIPGGYAAGAAAVITLDDITLNTGENILLDSTANTVIAAIDALPATINVDIVVP